MLEHKSEFIGQNLVLINLNAAILEGTLRSLICEILQRDSEKIGELSIIKKETSEYVALIRSYAVLKNFQDDVEFRGGWDNLKRQYNEYLNINLDDLLSKEKTNGINAIFTLRNFSAHGTGIVTPKNKLDDAQKDSYPFKWQSKVQGLTVYVKKEFNLELLESFSHPSFSKHFMDLTKELVSELNKRNGIPENAKLLLNNLEKYSFGHRNFIKYIV